MLCQMTPLARTRCCPANGRAAPAVARCLMTCPPGWWSGKRPELRGLDLDPLSTGPGRPLGLALMVWCNGEKGDPAQWFGWFA